MTGGAGQHPPPHPSPGRRLLGKDFSCPTPGSGGGDKVSGAKTEFKLPHGVQGPEWEFGHGCVWTHVDMHVGMCVDCMGMCVDVWMPCPRAKPGKGPRSFHSAGSSVRPAGLGVPPGPGHLGSGSPRLPCLGLSGAREVLAFWGWLPPVPKSETLLLSSPRPSHLVEEREEVGAQASMPPHAQGLRHRSKTCVKGKQRLLCPKRVDGSGDEDNTSQACVLSQWTGQGSCPRGGLGPREKQGARSAWGLSRSCSQCQCFLTKGGPPMMSPWERPQEPWAAESPPWPALVFPSRVAPCCPQANPPTRLGFCMEDPSARTRGSMQESLPRPSWARGGPCWAQTAHRGAQGRSQRLTVLRGHRRGVGSQGGTEDTRCELEERQVAAPGRADTLTRFLPEQGAYLGGPGPRGGLAAPAGKGDSVRHGGPPQTPRRPPQRRGRRYLTSAVQNQEPEVPAAEGQWCPHGAQSPGALGLLTFPCPGKATCSWCS